MEGEVTAPMTMPDATFLDLHERGFNGYDFMTYPPNSQVTRDTEAALTENFQTHRQIAAKVKSWAQSSIRQALIQLYQEGRAVRLRKVTKVRPGFVSIYRKSRPEPEGPEAA